ncbi:superoxide dismutase [Puteibacter caeruleilacunae]|nr:superoxide dismutase [Puteibacter caeruleilacunae]
MKILAIERDVEGANWDNAEGLLKSEAQHVFDLYLSDTLREIYFTENKNAVLILECQDKAMAKKMLDAFPLVKEGKIVFDLLELRPYNGYERLIHE